MKKKSPHTVSKLHSLLYHLHQGIDLFRSIGHPHPGQQVQKRSIKLRLNEQNEPSNRPKQTVGL